MADCINIVLKVGNEPGVDYFVEIEDDQGKGIKIGKVITSGHGFYKIRIKPEDIEKA